MESALVGVRLIEGRTTRLGFSGKVPEAEIEPLRQRFLHHYRAIVADESRLFDGYDEILNELEARAIPWGIVTNKPRLYAEPILAALNLSQRCGSLPPVCENAGGCMTSR